MNEFEIAVINEPAMFEQSNSYHFTLSDVETFFFSSGDCLRFMVSVN